MARGQGRDGRRRRRQRVSRLRRRHRRQLDRPLPSRRGRRHRRSGAEVPAHVGHGLLLRAAGAPRRGDERDCAVGRARSGRSSPIPAPKRSRRRSSSRGTTRRRHGIIAFLGSFHGRTLGSLSLTSSKAIQRRGFGPPLGGVYHAPYPNPYRRPAGQSVEQCAAATLDYIEDQILVNLVSPDEVAAVVVEPIQGEGGYVVPPPAFHAAAARADAQARHPADRRRSAVGHGAHRQDVRHRALRRRAGRRRDRQGHRVGAAARRHDGARGHHGLAARRRTPARSAATRWRAPRRSRRSRCSRSR